MKEKLYSREEWALLTDEQRGSCVEWQGTRQSEGYGQINTRGPNRGKLAHRVTWEEAFGPIAIETPCVLHHCDNPPCHRVSHLFLGTRADNNHDRDAKGRLDRRDGVHNGNSKLNWDAVRQIRQRDDSTAVLATDFGVSTKQIRLVKRNLIWRES